MPDLQSFRLPDVGEGLTEAEIVSWKVAPGQTVTLNQTIVEIETAKSLVELPCPFAGVVTELSAAEGEMVAVGTPIIVVDTAPDATVPGVPAAELPGTTAAAASTVPDTVEQIPTPAADRAVEPGLIGGPAPGGRTSVLVGYGPRVTEATRRPRRGGAAAQEPAITEPPAITESPRAAPLDPAPASATAPLATPPVRKLAKDLGVDLRHCRASGPHGTVTRDDVRAVAAPAAAAGRSAASSDPRGTRVPVKGVRAMTAKAMVDSAFTAPHVTEFLTVDVTRTMKLLERLRADPAFEGVKVSPLLLVAKALLVAIRRNPGINAHWDDDGPAILTPAHVGLGIAAATPRGLIVPTVADADTLSLRELADALADLTATARAGRTQPAQTSGGTITITNVGMFGVDTGTPILNPGQAAILCLGAIRRRPWVHRGEVVPRWVTELALSFDHRVVDGDLGSRVLSDVGAVLERPDRAVAWG